LAETKLWGGDMQLARFAIVFCLILSAVPVWTQQTSTQPTPSPAPKDPQAVSIANQALAVTGGGSAIRAIDDMTAGGTITYHVPTEMTGPVTIRESGLTQLRLDSELPSGVRSQTMADGEVTFRENGITRTAPEPPPFYSGRIVLPQLFLAVATIGPQFRLSYGGIIQIDNRPAHDIEIERVVHQPDIIKYKEGLIVHLFVDSATLQIVMMQDVTPRGETRQTRYSDWKAVTGALVPCALSEQIGGRQTWTIQLAQINFNTGLQDSDFQL
jgi:hypothetical protein